MSALPKHVWTPDEYLAFERASEFKHEYLNGEIYDMTGASYEHNLIVANVIVALGGQLKNHPCKTLPSDMRVKVAKKHYTYPDIVFLCGDPVFEDNEFDTLLNPTVIIEVLSRSTALYDRTTKLQAYRALDSLQAYLMITQDHPHIEYYLRQTGSTWLYSEINGLEAVIELPSLQCTLSMSDIYANVTLGLEPPNSEA